MHNLEKVLAHVESGDVFWFDNHLDVVALARKEMDDSTSELKRLRELTEWRDIETAPKDGTHIIVACGKFVYKVHWSDEARFEKFEEKPGWQVFDCPDGFYSIALEPDEPKAWFPIPEPPQETK